MAGVAWRVQYNAPKLIKESERKFYEENEVVDKKYTKAYVSACIQINEDGKEHWVNKKADMRALQNMRRALNKFEETCEKALKQAEEANAPS
jgi:hypothetical protein